MRLIYHPASPYARKARVAAIELGLADAVEPVHVGLTIGRYNAEVGATNPVGKVPALITDDGEALYDSHVICEYLDALAGGGRLLPPPGPARWPVLRLHALADEIILAGQIIRQEPHVRAPEQVSERWLDLQRARIAHGLDTAETLAGTPDGPVDLGAIGLGCAVGWLAFRGLGEPLREGRPRLFAWYDEFARRPSMVETEPRDD